MQSLPSEESFIKVADQLDRLTANSMLGHRLFSFALRQIISERITGVIREELATLSKLSKISSVDMVATTSRARDRIMELAEVESQACKRRTVKIKYANWELSVDVASVEEEIECHLRTHLRAWCSCLKLVPPLAGEREVSTYDKVAAEEVERSLYAKTKTAREFACTLIKGESKIDGEKVKEPSPCLTLFPWEGLLVSVTP